MRGTLLLAVMGVAGSAGAQALEPQRFGARGGLVLNGDLSITGGHRWAGGDSNRSDFTFLSVRPSLDYFVLDRLSLGATLGLGATFNEFTDVTQYGAGLRIGYALPLAERVSLWPRLGASLYHQKRTVGSSGFEDEDSLSFGTFELFTPVLVHATSSFFLGLGPALALDVGDVEGTTLGFQTLVGGVF